MSIRLSSNCKSCAELAESLTCNVHNVKVNEKYTCDSFSSASELINAIQCTNCAFFQKDNCSKPAKATEGMLCGDWAPANV
ncbi:hypothetical protein [Flammeovirga sp. EKP202]|uniref:hypothetical protein n=1 Tax=Flammeovirga sp. EKP202 TaxID=2770592 RepID=UPI00165FF052|nr:hypothetical protein [Flammeovirga sp. EKP202]MBD0399737.1 hypothetical protein [Flammeovirga sp. EKP202]